MDWEGGLDMEVLQSCEDDGKIRARRRKKKNEHEPASCKGIKTFFVL